MYHLASSGSFTVAIFGVKIQDSTIQVTLPEGEKHLRPFMCKNK